ncbi:MAG: conjugal transfer protein TraW [Steroidobacteraceae bacterium]|nr:conjugal transfer protein TraW [Steroidobacteraceae bacterium]
MQTERITMMAQTLREQAQTSGAPVVRGNDKAALAAAAKAIAQRAQTLREQPTTRGVPDNAHQDEARAQASELFSRIRSQGPDTLPAPPSMAPAGRMLFFVSHSLGQDALDDIFRIAARLPEALIVFRGVRDAEHFADSVMEIQRRAAAQTPVASVVIDPTLFRDHGIAKVPTILYLDQERSAEVARVAGLSRPDWLLEKVKHGKQGDFGVRGPVEDILERDLIEVMQEKVAAIDWVEKKRQAETRFWAKQQFIALPRADQPRRRYLDPTVVVTEDIRDGEGKVLVARGAQINPLNLQAFTQAVVVLDPLDPAQLALVDARLPELAQTHAQVTLIVTRFDQAAGWASYTEVTDHFDAPVFTLTPDVRERFELEYVPSVITAERTQFVIEELAVLGEETP